jgi:hypothetical protein
MFCDVSELMTPPVADALREFPVPQPRSVATREPLLHELPSFHANQLDATAGIDQMGLHERLPAVQHRGQPHGDY